MGGSGGIDSSQELTLHGDLLRHRLHRKVSSLSAGLQIAVKYDPIFDFGTFASGQVEAA